MSAAKPLWACALAVALAAGAQAAQQDEASLLMQADRLERGIRMSNRNVNDPELTEYLRAVTCKAVQEHCGDLRVYVVRAPGFNAFMLPNGAMVVQSGLLLRLDSEAELAAVLGHEASHHVRRHSLNRWRKLKRTSSALAMLSAVASAGGAVSKAGTGSAGGWSTAGSAVAFAEVAAIYQMFAYNRKQEQQADLDGIQWMAAGGYDAGGAPAVWRKLVAELEAADADGGFSLLSTHPAPKKRMQYLTSAAQDMAGAGSGSTIAPAASFTGRFARYREDWLTDEMASIHPARFAFVANAQRGIGFPAGLSSYMEARVWLRHVRRGKANERTGAISQALAAFQRGEAAPDDMPAQAHREWGRALLLPRRADLTAAQGRFDRYFELKPEARDRSTITSLMERRRSKRR